eukprot:CAMPEP_0172521282 /NCGR_PEP_ID=MMETSP1066-20121228/292493_1 /TAXON_ID=671091 /ORGANISM="Coscinodiscus wailesii, Strain CCMP2513" /LENGTH=158 /DNA_ID=CAMNT_0013304179 /DNA_START=273 /DNA_END=749 /DNA_ORIENTATION=-
MLNTTNAPNVTAYEDENLALPSYDIASFPLKSYKSINTLTNKETPNATNLDNNTTPNITNTVYVLSHFSDSQNVDGSDISPSGTHKITISMNDVMNHDATPNDDVVSENTTDTVDFDEITRAGDFVDDDTEIVFPDADDETERHDVSNAVNAPNFLPH